MFREAKEEDVPGLPEELKHTIAPILERHGVVRASVFGSFARGMQTVGSDLDILIEFAGDKSLLDLAALQLDLEDALGREVDVVTYNSLNFRIRDNVLREQVPVL